VFPKNLQTSRLFVDADDCEGTEKWLGTISSDVPYSLREVHLLINIWASEVEDAATRPNPMEDASSTELLGAFQYTKSKPTIDFCIVEIFALGDGTDLLSKYGCQDVSKYTSVGRYCLLADM
jgi:hypothetical protein